MTFVVSLILLASVTAYAGDSSKPVNDSSKPAGDSSKPEEGPNPNLVQQLLLHIEQLEARVATLEAEKNKAAGSSAPASASTGTSTAGNAAGSAKETASPSGANSSTVNPSTADSSHPSGAARENNSIAASAPAASGREPAPAPPASPPSPDQGGHTLMDIQGGPNLKIRGFLDFNLDAGRAANPLIYPLAPPSTPIANGFQFGEFDLFFNSRLSSTISFLSEVVFGADQTNNWSIDIERAQISFKPSKYIQLSGGRMHTAIGYYNTAFHHGAWFQTATGRPFMYYFEDSGGILPVHLVGVEAAGLIPHTGKLNAHWIFEAGNGLSSESRTDSSVNPVQNFLSDKNHKAFNVAGYIRPDWLRGLQIGGNYYNDTLIPPGIPHVNNAIPGLYAVYITPVWEFLNEFDLQRDHVAGTAVTFNTPLAYTQISRKFGKYRPYFRWQEVNVPANDPIYSAVGRYEGPSPGLRMDFTDFAALKVQYNRIYTRGAVPMNGLDGQVSLTF
jgi:hypothetical protein